MGVCEPERTRLSIRLATGNPNVPAHLAYEHALTTNSYGSKSMFDPVHVAGDMLAS